MNQRVSLYLKDESQTEAIGQKIAQIIHPGLVIYLQGQLGAGKTALARSLIRALGHQGKVKSPTYALVELYTISRLNLYHFDLYRFDNPEEWLDAGFAEYVKPDTICLIEWPEKGGALIPQPDLTISLEISGEGRQIEIEAHTETGDKCLMRLNN